MRYIWCINLSIQDRSSSLIYKPDMPANARTKPSWSMSQRMKGVCYTIQLLHPTSQTPWRQLQRSDPEWVFPHERASRTSQLSLALASDGEGVLLNTINKNLVVHDNMVGMHTTWLSSVVFLKSRVLIHSSTVLFVSKHHVILHSHLVTMATYVKNAFLLPAPPRFKKLKKRDTNEHYLWDMDHGILVPKQGAIVSVRT